MRELAVSRSWGKKPQYTQLVIRLPLEVSRAKEDLATVYLISTDPLIIAEDPNVGGRSPCPQDAVETLKKKIESRSFRKAVGESVIKAIESIIEFCERQ